MKKTLIFLCFALSATGAVAQVDGGGISDSMMERIRKAIEEDRYEEFRSEFFSHYDMSRNF